MNFELNDIQQMLSRTVADFVRKQSPVSRARTLRDDPVGWDPAIWRQMGELGWIAAPFPEHVGGYGTFIEAAIILEQLGRALAPEPFAEALVAGMALAQTATPDQRERFLSPLLAGETSCALAWAENGSRYAIARPATSAHLDGEGVWRLDGHKTWVPNGHCTDHLIVSAKTGRGPSLFIIDRDTEGVEQQVAGTIDGRKAAWFKFEGAPVETGRLLGEEGQAGDLLEWLFDVGAAAAVAEGVGVAQRAFEITLEYLNTRKQFGARIGSFQALQHRSVEMFVEMELLRSIAMASMVHVSHEDADERRRWISAAKVQLRHSGKRIVHEATQLHGGIGITDEADIGLYFKRIHALTVQFGDDAHHVARVAALTNSGSL